LRLADDGLMLAGKALPLVHDLAQVHPVVQHLVDGLLGEGSAALGHQILGSVGLHHQRGRPHGHEVVEDAPHQGGLGLVDHQQPVANVVAERQRPAHPHPFGLAGGDLVADAFASDLALELGERQQDVEHQPAHRGGRVDLLRDGAEADAVAVEYVHHAREIGQ